MMQKLTNIYYFSILYFLWRYLPFIQIYRSVLQTPSLKNWLVILTNRVYFWTAKPNTTGVEGSITPSQHCNTTSFRVDHNVISMGPGIWKSEDEFLNCYMQIIMNSLLRDSSILKYLFHMHKGKFGSILQCTFPRSPQDPIYQQSWKEGWTSGWTTRRDSNPDPQTLPETLTTVPWMWVLGKHKMNP